MIFMTLVACKETGKKSVVIVQQVNAENNEQHRGKELMETIVIVAITEYYWKKPNCPSYDCCKRALYQRDYYLKKHSLKILLLGLKNQL